MLFVAPACKKSFLKEVPTTFYTEEGAFGTDGGAKSSLIGLYSTIAGYDYFGTGYIMLTSEASGSFYSPHAVSRAVAELKVESNSSWIYMVYRQAYTAIDQANTIIANLPNSKVSASVSNNILGQTYFIRGMLYFNLVRMWGGVPLRLEPVNQSNLYKPRASADEVYAQVISDLEKAKTLLPEPAVQEKGFPHKYAPYALLGKVYVTLAGDNNPSPYWQKAKDELLEVVNQEGTAYTLESSFANLFSYTNENTRESIFEIQFIPTTPSNGQLTNYFMPGNISTQPLAQRNFQWLRPNKEVYDRHAAQYPNDPRLATTFVAGTYKNRANGNVTTYPLGQFNNNTNGFPFIRKYEDPSYVIDIGGRNLIYMRYADVLLLLAEAENEINGPANAYQYVNKVLTRARNTVSPAAAQPANFAGMDQATFRTRIMEERYYELLGEFHEYFDVRRRGVTKFLAYLKAHNDYPNLRSAYEFVYPLNERLMLMPIPDGEMNYNRALQPGDQNPGY
ncbi:RagB/SusD family nutrient uptake outer membrane protein [Niabella aquatica]